MSNSAIGRTFKNRRIQTIVTTDDACIQKSKIKEKHVVAQTHTVTRNVQSNTEAVGQLDDAVGTALCETKNRHIQTFLKTKSKSTQSAELSREPPKRSNSPYGQCE